MNDDERFWEEVDLAYEEAESFRLVGDWSWKKINIQR